jgi:hypothetical protein
MKSQVEIKRGAYLPWRLIGTLLCLPSIRGPRGIVCPHLGPGAPFPIADWWPMTRRMLQGGYDDCNMGGLPAQQQNPTGGRRLGFRGAVVGRLWIFAGVAPAFSHEKVIPPAPNQSAADRLRTYIFVVGGPLPTWSGICEDGKADLQ